MPTNVVNVGRAMVTVALVNGLRISFPIEGKYKTQTTGDLEHLRSMITPISVRDEFERLKELWKSSKTIQYMSHSYLMSDVASIELGPISEFNIVVPG